MRDNRQVTREVERRIGELRTRRAKRKSRLYAATAIASCLALVVGLSLFLPGIVPESVPESSELYRGTLLADSSTGGYVLVGVLAFVLGVVVTLLIIRRREKSGEKHV